MSKRLDQTRIDRIAAAIAEADSADYWVPEITDWETSEEWKREAYPDEYPSSAYEDRERYRKQARAALLALEPEAREITDAERQKLNWLPLVAVAQIDAREAEHIRERITVQLWPMEWESIKAELAGRKAHHGDAR